ncbi:MAG TPA: methyltransferase domain-containing protein, partial [Acidimicrobiales bacterium]|nr:methyltransferase domain-containing protein [Acidimicrobiales bacterium]
MPDATAAWTSYDSVAAAYARVAVPWFTPLARDLVDAMALRAGETVVDVGTGTGLVAGIARPLVAPGGIVVGVDPSTGMLLETRQGGSALLAGRCPGLPIAGSSVDVVVANLSLSHLPTLEGGVADFVRILRPGGRLGVTAWASPLPAGDGNDLAAVDDMLQEIRVAYGFEVPPAAGSAGPFQQALMPDGRLGALLEGAGLTGVSVEARRYSHTFLVEDYLVGWGSNGRYLRHVHGPERWEEFT